jgi:hypothetical protein
LKYREAIWPSPVESNYDQLPGLEQDVRGALDFFLAYSSSALFHDHLKQR